MFTRRCRYLCLAYWQTLLYIRIMKTFQTLWMESALCEFKVVSFCGNSFWHVEGISQNLAREFKERAGKTSTNLGRVVSLSKHSGRNKREGAMKTLPALSNLNFIWRLNGLQIMIIDQQSLDHPFSLSHHIFSCFVVVYVVSKTVNAY